MIFGYLFIFIARVTDMSLFTLRMLFLVKGRRLTAAALGFVEVIIYITALGKVVNGLSDYRNLLAYALGYACGNYLGSYLEEKLAVGKLTAQIVCSHCDRHQLAEKLRQEGFGVTVVEGEGKHGKRHILNVMLARKNVRKLYNVVESTESNPFVTIFDIKSIKGGYFTKMRRK